MRTEVTDNWFVVVDRFAGSSLRMIFVGQRKEKGKRKRKKEKKKGKFSGQTGCRCIFLADFGERLGFAIS